MNLTLNGAPVGLNDISQLDTIFTENFVDWGYTKQIGFAYSLKGFKKDNINPISVSGGMVWNFDDDYYMVQSSGSSEFHKNYSQVLNEAEIDLIVNEIGKTMFSQISRV